MHIQSIISQHFAQIADLVRMHAGADGSRLALANPAERLTYSELDAFMDRVAAALQRDGIVAGHTIAICGEPSPRYAALYLGALRAGVVVAPLAPGLTAESFRRMLENCEAKVLFIDATIGDLAAKASSDGGLDGMRQVRFDDSAELERWLGNTDANPFHLELPPEAPFNIIYSSGTTGEPKGIVQSHGMRWAHVQRALPFGYEPGKITLLATPLYSNTTLITFFPSVAFGHTIWLMRKFDARAYLELAVRVRATHTVLVPVQYQRIMAVPDFGVHELSSFEYKFSTSAPFSAQLKADVLARWPGGLVEFYGMTEGGGTCMLEAHRFPDKLHTVGRPVSTSDIRLIDDQGLAVAPGDAGEIVGHSPGMMTGYHRAPSQTREAEWHDSLGKRFIRTGDVGRFDADGFLILVDRKKDVIISGGFNIYPSDLEAVLREHPAVQEAAVVGVPCEQWGETPVAFVVLRGTSNIEAEALRAWANQRVGKTQRLANLRITRELPRSEIGKVLKRELRAAYLRA